MADGYWSAHKGYAPNWFSLCAATIRERITGSPHEQPTPWAIDRVTGGRRVGSILEVGCLSGNKLASFKSKADRLVGIDYAAGAVERGREMHPDIDFHVMDLNQPQSMNERFDLILANGVLHHIEQLEACADWLADHLNPGGALIASEFTGPQRYRYSADELAEIDDAIRLLPPDLQHPFDVRSLDCKLAADPSESVRTDIERVLRARFSVEAKPYGGNVLQRALGPAFFKSFDPDSISHQCGLRRVASRDAELMRNQSHHAFFIARHGVSQTSICT